MCFVLHTENVQTLPFTQVHRTPAVFQSSVTRSRGEECTDTHGVMRLHRGAETHQTPTEHCTAGHVIYSKRKEHLKDNHRLFNFPSETLRTILIISLPLVHHLSPQFTPSEAKISIHAASSFSTSLSPSLSLSLNHAEVRTTQLCDR